MKKDTDRRRHFENVMSYLERGGIIGVYTVPEQYQPCFKDNPVFPKEHSPLLCDDGCFFVGADGVW